MWRLIPATDPGADLIYQKCVCVCVCVCVRERERQREREAERETDRQRRAWGKMTKI